MVLKVRKQKTPAGRAEAMGRRAGEDLRRYGLPTRCPFRRRDLAGAWARGYIAGVDNKAPRP